jgi:flagellar hook-length control protein FliK
VLASFIKDDLKPLATQLNQIIEHTQDKTNNYKSMPHNGIEIANKGVEKPQVSPKVKSLSQSALPNEVPKVSKEDLKLLLKKIDALIEPAGNEIKQQKFSTVNNQLLSHDRVKTPAPLVQIDSADKQVVDKLNNNDVNLIPVKDESKQTSSAQVIKQVIKQEIKLDNNGRGIGRLQQANKEQPIDSDELPADLITMTKNQQKQYQAVEQIAVNIAAPKQTNNQPTVRDVGRIVNAEMAEQINQQDIDTAIATEQIEQPISFSKLLGTMKNNASTSVLSQLMTQVQSSQSQQAERIDFELHQMTQQVTQLARHSNQTPVTTEQLVHNSINTARSEVTKALYNKANIMLNLNLKEAEVRLDPPELGAMQIRLRSDAEQAQINFIVQNQAAKEMLEQTMGKLKEMLAEQGIELGESSVSEQGSESEQQSEPSSQESSQEPSQEIATMVEKESQHLTNDQIVNNKQDVIDFYA